MARRESEWTMIYWDSSNDPANPGLKAYVRLTPPVDLEEFGFPHGISVGGQMFDTKEQAEAFADRVDRLMDAVKATILSK